MGALNQEFLAALKKFTLPAILVALSVLCAAVTGYQSYVIYQALNDNRALQNGVPEDSGDDLRPSLLLAKAWRLHQEKRFDEALQIYNTIENNATANLKEQAMYNAATLLLTRAAKLWNESGVSAHAEVDTLVNLAEHGFRKVLRQNPDNWDARYNLEYTLRIRPPRKEVGKSDWEGRKSSVYAILPGILREGP